MVPMVSMVMRVTTWTTLAMARNDGDETVDDSADDGGEALLVRMLMASLTSKFQEEQLQLHCPHGKSSFAGWHKELAFRTA